MNVTGARAARAYERFLTEKKSQTRWKIAEKYTTSKKLKKHKSPWYYE